MKLSAHFPGLDEAFTAEAPPSPLVKDVNLRVPAAEYGEFFQILDDNAILGGARDVGAVEDIPAIVNKEWGLVTRYPGFDGVEYQYVVLSDEWLWTMYRALEWGSSYMLSKGKIIKYEDKFDNGGKFPIVDRIDSMLWVWTETIMKGKSHTDSDNAEYGARDPITKRNMTARNLAYLLRPMTGKLCRRLETRGAYWGYEVLNVLQPPPSFYSIVERPWLWEWGVTITKKQLPNGRYITDDFPQIAEAFKRMGLPRTGTPYLSMGKGNVVWILKSSCTPILEPGSRWSSYYPPKQKVHCRARQWTSFDA